MSHLLTLQTFLKTHGYAAVLLPRADEHLGEYILPHAERVKWLTGFTGSAGFVIIMQDSATLFVDGRYILQAPQEVSIDVRHFMQPPPREWLKPQLKPSDKIAYDPMLHSMSDIKAWHEFNLVPIDNPIPPLAPYPRGDIYPQPLKYAGQSMADKIAAVRDALVKAKAECTVFCQLDSIAWLLNIRGSDTQNTPLVQCFLVISLTEAIWYVDETKFTDKIYAHLGNLIVRPLADFKPNLKNVYLTPEVTTQFIANHCEGIIEGKDLVDLPRARKNPTELAGMRAAHKRDGVAYAKFLHWFFETPVKDELSVSAKLEEFRAEHPAFRGNSFETIAGAGANAAIVHYRSSVKTNIPLKENSLFLLDSGGQYVDGTTDITRSFSLGSVEKKHYTLVLKGHLALSRARFPQKTSGTALDAIARQYLWQAGLNFDHGTGHGVGAFLGVHEGSFRISPLATCTFAPGMVLSNEPGYYKDGSHGIRIENLLVVEEGVDGFFQFETLTLVPYDKRGIDKSLLTSEEITQINQYHTRVYAEIGSSLKGAVRDNLKRLCAKL
jgi:Xaa-Pro aminopeptidase